MAILAYCLQVTLKARLRTLAAALTPRQVLDTFKTNQMVDVYIPATDGRELVLSRHSHSEAEHRMLLSPLRMTLPEQPPPKIIAKTGPQELRGDSLRVVETFALVVSQINNLAALSAAS